MSWPSRIKAPSTAGSFKVGGKRNAVESPCIGEKIEGKGVHEYSGTRGKNGMRRSIHSTSEGFLVS